MDEDESEGYDTDDGCATVSRHFTMKTGQKWEQLSSLPILPTTPPTMAPIGTEGGLGMTVDEFAAVITVGPDGGIPGSVAVSVVTISTIEADIMRSTVLEGFLRSRYTVIT